MCAMNKNTRLYILVISGLCIAFMYLSQTLVGLITDLHLVQTNVVFRNIVNKRRGVEFPTYFNNPAVKESIQFCSEIQVKAKIRISDYCKSKSTNWTKVKIVERRSYFVNHHMNYKKMPPSRAYSSIIYVTTK